jgi:hypothetical protein
MKKIQCFRLASGYQKYPIHPVYPVHPELHKSAFTFKIAASFELRAKRKNL